MKDIKKLIALLAIPLIAASCNKEEGEGGRSTIEGHVYMINVNDDLTRDTFPANDQRVQIIYGDKSGYDDTKTVEDGFYQFKYLHGGDYTLIAYNDLPSNEQTPASKKIHINGKNKTYLVDPIYIETGKAVNTYWVSGKIGAKYIDKDISAFIGDTLPAIDVRVFLEKKNDPVFLEDVRTHEDGSYTFTRLTPGKYRVWVVYENHYTDIPTSVGQDFEITNEGKIIIDEEEVENLGLIVTRINT